VPLLLVLGKRAEVVVEAAEGHEGRALVELALQGDDGLLADRQREVVGGEGSGRRRRSGGEGRERGAGVGRGLGS